MRIRSSNASDRLAALGGWCERREGVEIVERADGETGALLSVALQVSLQG